MMFGNVAVVLMYLYVGKELLFDLRQTNAAYREFSRNFRSFFTRHDLPRDFNPVSDDHMAQFLAARDAIVAERLGPEMRPEYNPLEPAYYKHTLPPKDPEENMIWAKKARNWDDYVKWIREEHPVESAALENGTFWTR